MQHQFFLSPEEAKLMILLQKQTGLLIIWLFLSPTTKGRRVTMFLFVFV